MTQRRDFEHLVLCSGTLICPVKAIGCRPQYFGPESVTRQHMRVLRYMKTEWSFDTRYYHELTQFQLRPKRGCALFASDTATDRDHPSIIINLSPDDEIRIAE